MFLMVNIIDYSPCNDANKAIPILSDCVTEDPECNSSQYITYKMQNGKYTCSKICTNCPANTNTNSQPGANDIKHCIANSGFVDSGKNNNTYISDDGLDLQDGVVQRVGAEANYVRCLDGYENIDEDTCRKCSDNSLWYRDTNNISHCINELPDNITLRKGEDVTTTHNISAHLNPGYSMNADGNTSECGAGTYREDERDITSEIIEKSYTDITCQPCVSVSSVSADGNFADGNFVSGGKWQDQVGSSECKTLPTNNHPNGFTSTPMNDEGGVTDYNVNNNDGYYEYSNGEIEEILYCGDTNNPIIGADTYTYTNECEAKDLLPGYYNNGSNIAECPSGYYCGGGAIISATKTPCPVNTYNPDQRSTSIDDCILCPTNSTSSVGADSCIANVGFVDSGKSDNTYISDHGLDLQDGVVQRVGAEAKYIRCLDGYENIDEDICNTCSDNSLWYRDANDISYCISDLLDTEGITLQKGEDVGTTHNISAHLNPGYSMSIGGTISKCEAGTYRDGQEDITSNIIENSYTDITCQPCLLTLSANDSYVSGGEWQDEAGSSECKTLPTNTHPNGFTSTPMNDERYNVNNYDGYYESGGNILYCGKTNPITGADTYTYTNECEAKDLLPGYYNDDGNITQCPSGYYCGGGAIISATKTPCPVNTISVAGSSNINQCIAIVGFVDSGKSDNTYIISNGLDLQDGVVQRVGVGENYVRCLDGYENIDEDTCNKCLDNSLWYRDTNDISYCINDLLDTEGITLQNREDGGTTHNISAYLNAGYSMSTDGTISECGAGTYRDGQEDITSNIIEKSYTDITCQPCLLTLSADGSYVSGGEWQEEAGSSECKTLPTNTYANGFTRTPMNYERYYVNNNDGYYELGGNILYCGDTNNPIIGADTYTYTNECEAKDLLPGYYNDDGNIAECPSGYYCGGGAIISATKTPCPVNTYNPDQRSTSIDDCILCPTNSTSSVGADSCIANVGFVDSGKSDNTYISDHGLDLQDGVVQRVGAEAKYVRCLDGYENIDEDICNTCSDNSLWYRDANDISYCISDLLDTEGITLQKGEDVGTTHNISAHLNPGYSMSIGGTISKCEAGTYRDGQEDITSNIIENSYTDITCQPCLLTLSANDSYVSGGEWQDEAGSSECKTLPTNTHPNGFTSTPMNDERYNVNNYDGYYESGGNILYCGKTNPITGADTYTYTNECEAKDLLPGYYNDDGNITQCPSGYYCGGGAITPCPVNTISVAGSSNISQCIVKDDYVYYSESCIGEKPIIYDGEIYPDTTCSGTYNQDLSCENDEICGVGEYKNLTGVAIDEHSNIIYHENKSFKCVHECVLCGPGETSDGIICRKCEAGTKAVDGSCVVCDRENNKWQDEAGSSECKTLPTTIYPDGFDGPDGFDYIYANNGGVTGYNVNKDDGYYESGGNILYCGNTNPIIGADTYTYNDLTMSCEAKDLLPGYYNDNGNITQCPSGHYCGGGAITLCPVNTISVAGSSNISQCIVKDDYVYYSESCIGAKPIINDGEIDPDTTCSGTYNQDLSCENDEICGVGEYKNLTGVAIDEHSNIIYHENKSFKCVHECVLCGPGETSDGIICRKCEAGTKAVDGSCVVCDRENNKWQDEAGSSECKTLPTTIYPDGFDGPDGFDYIYANNGGVTGYNVNKDDGYYESGGNILYCGNTNPIIGADTYTYNDLTMSCEAKDLLPGYYNDNGNITQCPSGHYCGGGAITLCPVNTISVAGSSNISQCIVKDDYVYYSESCIGAKPIINDGEIDPDTTCSGTYNQDLSCENDEICGVGEYKNLTGVAIDEHSNIIYHENKSFKCVHECVLCGPGETSDGIICRKCEAGTKAVDGSCVVCDRENNKWQDEAGSSECKTLPTTIYPDGFDGPDGFDYIYANNGGVTGYNVNKDDGYYESGGNILYCGNTNPIIGADTYTYNDLTMSCEAKDLLPGYYNDNGNITQCPSGHYCGGGAITLCPVNTISVAGSSNISQCIVKDDYVYYSESCIGAKPIINDGEIDPDTTCSGTYNQDLSCENDEICGVGEYKNLTGVAIDEHSNIIYHENKSFKCVHECVLCGPGETSDGIICRKCEAGTKAVDGSCVVCDRENNKWQDEAGSSECKTLPTTIYPDGFDGPDGFDYIYANNGGVTGYNVNKDDGYYESGGNILYCGNTNPIIGADTYTYNDLTMSCEAKDLLPGYYNDNGNITQCPSGHYCGGGAITLCPVNTISVAGSSNISQCIVKDDYVYYSESCIGAKPIINDGEIDPDTTCSGTYNQDLSCENDEICGVGEYKNLTGVAIDEHSNIIYHENKSFKCVHECVLCGPGETSDGIICRKCEAGTKAVDGSCVVCDRENNKWQDEVGSSECKTLPTTIYPDGFDRFDYIDENNGGIGGITGYNVNKDDGYYESGGNILYCGKTNPIIGADTYTYTNECEAKDLLPGYYNNGSNIAECPSGYYCGGGAIISATKTLCPDNTISVAGSSNIDDCILCPTNSTSSVGADSCIANVGFVDSGKSDNTYIISNGLDLQDGVVQRVGVGANYVRCLDGYENSGEDICNTCSDNSLWYRDANDISYCINELPDNITLRKGEDVTTTHNISAHLNPGYSMSIGGTILKCEAGTYREDERDITSEIIEKSYTDITCHQCLPTLSADGNFADGSYVSGGKWQDLTGSSECKTLPTNTYTNGFTSTPMNDEGGVTYYNVNNDDGYYEYSNGEIEEILYCGDTNIGADTYTYNDETNECEAKYLSSGYYNNDGNIAQCPSGHYCGGGAIISATITPCSVNTYNPHQRSTSSDDCISCPVNSTSTVGADSCIADVGYVDSGKNNNTYISDDGLDLQDGVVQRGQQNYVRCLDGYANKGEDVCVTCPDNSYWHRDTNDISYCYIVSKITNPDFFTKFFDSNDRSNHFTLDGWAINTNIGWVDDAYSRNIASLLTTTSLMYSRSTLYRFQSRGNTNLEIIITMDKPYWLHKINIFGNSYYNTYHSYWSTLGYNPKDIEIYGARDEGWDLISVTEGLNNSGVQRGGQNPTICMITNPDGIYYYQTIKIIILNNWEPRYNSILIKALEFYEIKENPLDLADGIDLAG